MAKKRPPQATIAGTQQQTPETNVVQDQPVAESVTETQESSVAVETPQPQEPVTPAFRPTFPEWPTSKRGPQSTPPPPGMRSINRLRPEQLAEIAYNQETGEPSVQSPARSLPDENQGSLSFDQSETAQDVVRRRKKERL